MSQAQAIEQVKARRFVIATIDANGYFSMASRPFYHGNLPEVQAEVDRLAAKDSSKVFVPMQIVGGAKAVSLQRF